MSEIPVPETRERQIHALLVDDHATFRQGVAAVLGGDPTLKVDHCASIREALQILARETYDVVLLDHDLGPERASQFLPAARQIGFEGRVLLVTAWVSEMEARRLLRQGVSGIFLKHGQISQLAESIRTVVGGGMWLDPSFASMGGDADASPQPPPTFNERQRRVLRFVLEGLSNKEIAWHLQISESYVKAILQSLFHKTGVRTRGQLVRVAVEQYEDQL